MSYSITFAFQGWLKAFALYNILVTSIIMPRKCQKKKKTQSDCIICTTHKTNCRTIECNHQFCYRCFSKWGRRKGNCPLCRTEIRQVQYKNKIISPQYLLEFDQRIIFSSQEQYNRQQHNRAPMETPVIYAPSFYYYTPIIFVNYQETYQRSQ